jgi:syntaxin-binding protein 1
MPVPPGALRRRLQSRLLDGMIRKVGGGPGAWKVLVVDREALRILAAALGGLNDLVNEGVTIIEMLDMRREPLPRIPAIFFCAPSAESVQHLVAEAPRQYAEFHLFFTHRVPDFQMDVLRQNAAMLRRVKNFVELNVELLATESRAFSLDRPGASIPQLYGGTSRDALDEMSVISERLTDACGLVGQALDWTVRADAASPKARTVASLVKEQLETVKIKARTDRAHREAQGVAHPEDEDAADARAGAVKPTRATLLVLDRASDMVSPLTHEFTYQAIAHDLLRLDYTKPGGVHFDVPDDKDPSRPKSLQLDEEETDATWVATRHAFVEEARAEAQARFKEFLATDAAYKIRGKGGADVDINEMSAAVRSLPESQKRADKHTLHIVALSECLKLCGEMRLPELAIAEQDIAIGRHPDTTRAKPDAVIETLVALVQSGGIPLEHRMRLLMLAIAVAEGTVALGGETSLLALTSSFKLRLARSSVADVRDLSPAMAMSVKGFQAILTKAREAAQAFAERSGAAAGVRDGDGDSQARQFADSLKAKYTERRDVKLKEKQLEELRRRRAGRGHRDELPLDVARYLPPLTSVALDLVDETLGEDAFPLIGAVSVDSILSNLGGVNVGGGGGGGQPMSPPGGKVGRVGSKVSSAVGAAGSKLIRGRSTAGEARNPDDDEQFRMADPEHLFVIFFVGGVTYSELRSVYEVCARREANILIGGSQILTPRAFLDACAAVADPIIRMKVMMPPLPIELAQSRAARERTLKAGAEKKAAEAAAAAPPSGSGANGTSRGAGTKAGGGGGGGGGPEAGPDIVVVTGYEKKSMAQKMFGRKSKK